MKVGLLKRMKRQKTRDIYQIQKKKKPLKKQKVETEGMLMMNTEQNQNLPKKNHITYKHTVFRQGPSMLPWFSWLRLSR